MNTPRLHTSIIALLTKDSTTPGTLARPNDGRFSKSAEAKRMRSLCWQLDAISDLAMSESEKYQDLADHTSDRETYDKYIKRANEELETAVQASLDGAKFGC